MLVNILESAMRYIEEAIWNLPSLKSVYTSGKRIQVTLP